MKQTVTFTNFVAGFNSLRPENFSRAGQRALYYYLVELEEDGGGEIEFDVIALCCDFTEYESLAKFQENYDKEYKTIDDIGEDTTVIKTSGGGFIIRAF